MVSAEAVSELVKLARYQIEHSFGGMVRNLSAERDRILRMYPEVNQKLGVFVTIYKDKQLRGCIGFPQPNLPLWNGLTKAAESAAFHDSRFKSIEKGEINYLQFEVSVLTVPEEIQNGQTAVKNIKVGKDGLIVEMNGRSGLLLPQVAKENNFDALDFLQETCAKAGIQRTSWMQKECKIFKFQADIFKEVSKGKVMKIN